MYKPLYIFKFWERVRRAGANECWPWVAGKTTAGYGSLSLPGLRGHGYAHRVSYEITNGAIPAGMEILHTCDNPGCVNPNHLVVGTHRENMLDRERKGRGNQPKGEANAFAKLRESEVIRLRVEHATKSTSFAELGRKFGVSAVTASLIVKGKKWKHVRIVRKIQ